MIPRSLYELKPFLYLVAGGAIISLSGMALPVGILIYTFGAWLWLMRSERRRVNARQPRAIGARFYWGESLYEFKPFIYILGGVLVVGELQHGVRLLIGPLLIIAGMAVIAIRTSQRKKAPLPDRVLQPQKQPKMDRLKRELEQDLKREREQARELELGLALSGTADAGVIALFGAQAAVVEHNAAVGYHPLATGCDACQIVDICNSVKLDRRSVREIMRLSQTVAPTDALELYREAVGRIEGRRLSDDELQAVLNLLYSYSDHCITWRKTGRLAAH